MKQHLFLTTLLLLLLATVPAQAHRMRVFAYESGGEIVSEAKFGSGRPAKGIEIRVEDADGRVLLTGVTDDLGISRLPLPAAAREPGVDLTIIADGGEGHRGSWLLAAEDHQHASGGKAAESAAGRTAAPAAAAAPPLSPPEKGRPDLEYAAIEEIVQKSVAAELAPIKRMLAARQQRFASLQDILGGIGYILGLAGIAAYFQAKRKGESR